MLINFETCRRKRNMIDYHRSQITTETEAEEAVRKTKEFIELVENWIASDHPAYKKSK